MDWENWAITFKTLINDFGKLDFGGLFLSIFRVSYDNDLNQSWQYSPTYFIHCFFSINWFYLLFVQLFKQGAEPLITSELKLRA